MLFLNRIEILDRKSQILKIKDFSISFFYLIMIQCHKSYWRSSNRFSRGQWKMCVLQQTGRKLLKRFPTRQKREPRPGCSSFKNIVKLLFSVAIRLLARATCKINYHEENFRIRAAAFVAFWNKTIRSSGKLDYDSRLRLINVFIEGNRRIQRVYRNRWNTGIVWTVAKD